MHFQVAPHQEVKLVRCTRGSLRDAIIELRPESPTYSRWVSVDLSADNHRMVYVPEGCAHGFLTLEDETEASYHTSQFYSPAAAKGVRWNDPAFPIDWQAGVALVSESDRSWPDHIVEGTAA